MPALRFMASIRVQSLEVFPPHEPRSRVEGGQWKRSLPCARVPGRIPGRRSRPESGGERAALQTLPRTSGGLELREAARVRCLQHRFPRRSLPAKRVHLGRPASLLSHPWNSYGDSRIERASLASDRGPVWGSKRDATLRRNLSPRRTNGGRGGNDRPCDSSSADRSILSTT